MGNPEKRAHKIQDKGKLTQNTTQYVLDTTINKQKEKHLRKK